MLEETGCDFGSHAAEEVDIGAFNFVATFLFGDDFVDFLVVNVGENVNQWDWRSTESVTSSLAKKERAV